MNAFIITNSKNEILFQKFQAQASDELYLAMLTQVKQSEYLDASAQTEVNTQFSIFTQKSIYNHRFFYSCHQDDISLSKQCIDLWLDYCKNPLTNICSSNEQEKNIYISMYENQISDKFK
ncbi:Hypothetical_protein [Hexamita inflata]|uniref:Hypothetical_protein n=1 Tax=Hexamita inflata TaxID=28002 RepID=A0AA86P5V5_9EUKA|nr:Hypothetical protein HINF_LOCUS19971 [Hexamita inflata]